MAKILTGSQVSEFHKNGFLPAFSVLPSDQAVQLRANLESFEAEKALVSVGRVPNVENTFLHQRFKVGACAFSRVVIKVQI